MLAKMVNRDFLVSLASSLLTLILRPLVADAASVVGRTVAFARAAVECLARDEEVVAELAAGGGWGATERELEAAFHVFDRGEDGFICAAELWAVMRRLGFPEGARYEDCQRMIRALDGDGDGRISFPEFRRMMENAA